METMTVREEILFKADAKKVWELLVSPEMTRQYMFGCEIVSDFKVGSPIYWKGKTENGEEINYVKGTIIAYEEGKVLHSTTFDPNSTMKDVPENYVNLNYTIEEKTEGTLLTIVQGDFAGAEDGKKRYEESKSGWEEMVIPLMKKLMGE